MRFSQLAWPYCPTPGLKAKPQGPRPNPSPLGVVIWAFSSSPRPNPRPIPHGLRLCLFQHFVHGRVEWSHHLLVSVSLPL
ncbi:hypothetical protein Hanom_Chr13g01219391 [Helianthus anomalus]